MSSNASSAVRADIDAAPRGDWRRWMRRQVAWLLAAKLMALVALKVLFFSGDARVEATPDAVSGQLGVTAQAPAGGAEHD